MQKMVRFLALLLLPALLWGCSQPRGDAGGGESGAARALEMPAKVRYLDDGTPALRVYVKADEKVETVPLEEYLCGVLAGEMRSDWPLEALKAQAILARTFTLKFLEEKESRYEGADISTDVEEAQAYDASAVNDRVRQAVEETKGKVLTSGGELIYAWFHAHSGGKTAYAREGLNWKAEEPPYILVTEGRESEKAPADAQRWQASFTADEVIRAAATAGAYVETLGSAKVGQRGESGRAVTLELGGAKVNAADFRIALGSTRMRSTLLTNLALENGRLEMEGKGYGHGVGMSQWGAYGLAQQGKNAEEIVLSYYANVEVTDMY